MVSVEVAGDEGVDESVMSGSRSISSLGVAAVVAVVAHVLLLGAGPGWLEAERAQSLGLSTRQVERQEETRKEERRGDEENPPEKRPEEEEKIKLGSANSEVETSVAWISHEDYQRMIAPEGPVEQPAVQMEVEPVLEALETQVASGRANALADKPPVAPTPPPEISPAPEVSPERAKPPLPEASAEIAMKAAPVPEVRPEVREEVDEKGVSETRDLKGSDPRVTGAEESGAVVAGEVAKPEEEGVLELAAAVEPGEVEGSKELSHAEVGQKVVEEEKRAEAARVEEKREEGEVAHEKTEKVLAAAGGVTAAANPTASPGAAREKPGMATAAPRADKESMAVSLSPVPVKMRVGSVLTGEGIEIKPVRPRFSVVALSSGIPSNPRARIVFDETGRVVKVEMLKSTGYADFDGPLEASMYRWRASGPRVERMGRPFWIDVDVILIDEGPG